MTGEQDEFVNNGFIKIEGAFSRQWGRRARDNYSLVEIAIRKGSGRK